MTDSFEHNDSDRTQRRWRKARAVLAGGLIAGIGIVATQATWSSGVFSGTKLAGGDGPTPVIEVQNQSTSEWVAGDNDGQAHITAEISLPSKNDSSNRAITATNIGRMRVTNIAQGTVTNVTGTVDVQSTREDVAEALKGRVYLAPSGHCANTVPLPFLNFTSSNTANVPLAHSEPRTQQITIPAATASIPVCLSAELSVDDVPEFGPDDSATVTLTMVATPRP